MSQSEPVWPFQSLWSRLALGCAALGMSGAFLAGGMVFYGLFTNVPGGEKALGTAPLTATEGWETILELPLQGGDSVEFWEVQDPPAEDDPPGYSLVVRSPSGDEKAIGQSTNASVSVNGIRAEYRGPYLASEAGTHQVEVDVRGLPRGHDITLAAHPPGTVGPNLRWFAGLFAFALLAGGATLLCAIEIVRWLLNRVSDG